MRGRLVPFLLLFPLLTSPAAAGEADEGGVSASSPKLAKSWQGRLAKVQGDIAAGRWQAAAAEAGPLAEEMALLSPVGPAGCRQVASVLQLKVLAEVELGRHVDALWHWQIAQNLDPALRSSTFAATYGETGAWLERHRLRPASSWPEGVAEPEEGGDPPVPVAVPLLKIAPESYTLWHTRPFEVEVLIDAEGRVRSPVVLAGGELPAKVYFGLDVLRSWRFRPAHTATGEPAPALYRLKEFVGPDAFAFSVARTEGAQPGLALLLAGRWQEAAEAVKSSLRSCVTAAQASACQPTHLLVLQALAAAGAGDTEEALWSWHLVHNFNPGLKADWLTVFGRGLSRHFEGLSKPCPADPTCAVPRTESGPSHRAPVVVAAPRVELPPALRDAIDSDRLVATVVVGVDGRVREPWMVMGHSQTAGYLALQALRGWRFEPAQRDGEPVAVQLEVTIPVEPEVPLAEQESWREQMDRLDALSTDSALDPAAGQGARDEAQRLVAEIAGRIGGGGSDLLARALLQLALAEVRAGEEEQAVWHWQTAQNLAVEYRVRDLTGYGAAGELLAQNRLRDPGATRDPIGSTLDTRIWPHHLTAEDPSPAAAPPVQDVAVVEVLVDAEGRPRAPLVLRGRSPSGLFTALEELRTRRFTASRGAALDVALPLGSKQQLHQLELPESAARLADLALQRVKRDPETARCYWQSALALAGSLAKVDLRKRGNAAAVLEDASVPSDRWGFRVASDPAECKEGAESQDSAKLAAKAPSDTEALRRAKAPGQTVIVMGFVDGEGRINNPRIVRSLSPDQDVAAIEAFCRERRTKPTTCNRDAFRISYYSQVGFLPVSH